MAKKTANRKKPAKKQAGPLYVVLYSSDYYEDDGTMIMGKGTLEQCRKKAVKEFKNMFSKNDYSTIYDSTIEELMTQKAPVLVNIEDNYGHDCTFEIQKL